jgi:hypothetical protein
MLSLEAAIRNSKRAPPVAHSPPNAASRIYAAMRDEAE